MRSKTTPGSQLVCKRLQHVCQESLKMVKSVLSRCRGCHLLCTWCVPGSQKSCSRLSVVQILLTRPFSVFCLQISSFAVFPQPQHDPRWLQNGLGGPQDTLKMAPRRPQEAPKTPPKPKTVRACGTYFRIRVMVCCSWKLPRASLRFGFRREGILG